MSVDFFSFSNSSVLDELFIIVRTFIMGLKFWIYVVSLGLMEGKTH